jgi:hypothetical protein
VEARGGCTRRRGRGGGGVQGAARGRMKELGGRQRRLAEGKSREGENRREKLGL